MVVHSLEGSQRVALPTLLAKSKSSNFAKFSSGNLPLYSALRRCLLRHQHMYHYRGSYPEHHSTHTQSSDCKSRWHFRDTHISAVLRPTRSSGGSALAVSASTLRHRTTLAESCSNAPLPLDGVSYGFWQERRQLNAKRGSRHSDSCAEPLQ
jgi:hypothetical protein